MGVKTAGECRLPLARFQAEAPELAFGSDWTVIIACTPVAWENAWRRAGEPPTETGFTSVKAKLTVLNGAIFRNLRQEYRHTLAHELGHIRCACDSDAEAESVAALLLHPHAKSAALDAKKAPAGQP